jgi:phage tail-like protein
MGEFTLNPNRVDPYRNFKFRLKWDGRYVAGISKVSGLVKHRDGSDPSTSHKSPGQTTYEAITLERGVAADPDFAAWAANAWPVGADVPLASFRKDVILDVYNEAGRLRTSYKIYECWVSEYQALPDLDANASAVAIQHIKLENEGWDREALATEPTKPSDSAAAAFGRDIGL